DGIHRDYRRRVHDNPAVAREDARVGSAEVDGEVVGCAGKQESEHDRTPLARSMGPCRTVMQETVQVFCRRGEATMMPDLDRKPPRKCLKKQRFALRVSIGDYRIGGVLQNSPAEADAERYYGLPELSVPRFKVLLACLTLDAALESGGRE